MAGKDTEQRTNDHIRFAETAKALANKYGVECHIDWENNIINFEGDVDAWQKVLTELSSIYPDNF